MLVKLFPACFLFLVVWGCSAPHDNPLDPKSDHYVAPPVPPVAPDLSARVWSEHKSRLHFSSDIWQIVAAFEKPDTSLHLDSAWVVYDGRPAVTLSHETWTNQLSWSYFGCGQQMDCVLGQPFYFMARDEWDSVYDVGPVYVIRVIDGTPQISDPDSQEVTTPHVLLQWPPFNANFPYGFQAEITDSLAQNVVWSSPLLPSAQLVVDVSDSLANGDYLWTLTAIDSFGNRSRSKEGEFTVVAGTGL